VKKDYNYDWDNFWKSICCNKDGSLNLTQIKKELSDFYYVMQQVPKVYCHITGGKLSKLMYSAETIISEADDLITKDYIYKDDLRSLLED